MIRLLTGDFKELIFKGGQSLIMRILGFLFNYLYLYYVTSNFSLTSWGVFAISFTLLQVVGLIFSYGFNISIVQLLSSKDLGVGLILKIYKLIIPGFIILTILGYFLSQQVSGLFQDGSNYIESIKIMSFGILPYGLIRVNAAALRAKRHILWFNFLDSVGRFLIAFFLLFIASTIVGFDDRLIPITFVCGLYLLAIISTWSVFSKINDNIPGFHDSYSLESLLNFSFPIMISLLFQQALLWVNTLIGGVFLETKDIGAFDACVRVSSLTNIVLYAINSILMPQIATLYKKGDFSKLQKTLNLASSIITFMSVPLILIIMFSSSFILEYMNSELRPYCLVLIILLIGEIFNNACGTVGSFMNMTGLQKDYRNINLIIFSLNVVFLCLLMPVFGVFGLAIITSLSVIFKNVLSAIVIKRKTGYTTYFRVPNF